MTTTTKIGPADALLKLFNKSVMKQNKYRHIIDYLGPTDGLHCLDVGSDNGVISYLLRLRGGHWQSADLDEMTVSAIRRLVGTDVYQIDGLTVPFPDNTFDRVVIVDFLEHIHTDDAFIREMHRILKPGGVLIVNTPHQKRSLLRTVRPWIGQTDEQHGHVRQGYTTQTLAALLRDDFKVEKHTTYSKFFSEFIDTVIVGSVALLKRLKGQSDHSRKGLVITNQDLDANQSMFKLYAAIYPVVRLFSRLDGLLFFRSGYMFITRAYVIK